MTTVVEFLLARIAEDEHAASECVRLDADVSNLAGWVEMGADYTDAAIALGERFSPARVLAECKAKLRIVAIAQASWDAGGGYDQEAEDARAVCKALAEPYAKHPDYREEWRTIAA